MHLTNYSLNKISPNFVHTDDVSNINDGSKQTLASLYAELASAGYDVDLIKSNIKELIAKTLIAIQAGLSNQFESQLKLAKLQKLKCFQIIGIDVLLTEDCKAWLLEINANPSLRVDFESEISPGVMQSTPSPLDFFVKTRVVEDGILISRMKKSQQMGLLEFNSYEKLFPCDYDFLFCADLFMELKLLFSSYTEIKNPLVVPSGKFRRIYQKLKNHANNTFIPADIDLIYRKTIRNFDQSQMDYFSFISAIEDIASRYFTGPLIENVKHIISLLSTSS